MNKTDILKGLNSKGNGEIYLGIVGAVRTGKSTFIKKCIENLIIPNIEDESLKSKYIDEIPQSASGKTIMTIEPKFVPSNGANINVDGIQTNIKFVDCVGYVTPDAIGYQDDLGNPRMVKTPWFNEELPFMEAAEIGTSKVIKDHATIGIVITTDGSVTDLSRSNYINAEDKVINELKSINKPFIVVLNTKYPNSNETLTLVNGLKDKYNVPIIPISVNDMTENDIINILKEALYEFPIECIKFNIPDWISVLNDNKIKNEFFDKMKSSIVDVEKLRDVEKINLDLNGYNDISNAYISYLDTENSEVTITLDASDEMYNNIVNNMIGNINSKADMIKIFQNYSENTREFDGFKGALKQVYQTGYGIVLPKDVDMKLDKPEIIKQNGRFGIKLKAKASSVHLIKVDVESTFEPIIGSESQSKELIEHILSFENDPEKLWQSELFGRSLNEIVSEGIQAKLSMLPDTTKYKLSQTITKMVNKGSNNLIAIVL